ncbi:hypothetical protein RJC95_15525 [Acinetobacter baumannii]|nr:hypothetical protein [Acinetobacter baumannii]MDR9548163.1 hypothetical protein [Acinetobacter baumannii]
MTILQNAIDSIALGIEDYEEAVHDSRRLISCTRNRGAAQCTAL